jgi:hypothetical protein
MTEAEEKRYKAGIPKSRYPQGNNRGRENMVKKTRWISCQNLMPTPETVGEFVILEFKRMSDVTDQYVTQAKNVAVAQYASTT